MWLNVIEYVLKGFTTVSILSHYYLFLSRFWKLIMIGIMGIEKLLWLHLWEEIIFGMINEESGWYKKLMRQNAEEILCKYLLIWKLS